MEKDDDRYKLFGDISILDTRDSTFISLDEPERIVERLNSQERSIKSMASFWMDVFEELTKAEQEEYDEGGGR